MKNLIVHISEAENGGCFLQPLDHRLAFSENILNNLVISKMSRPKGQVNIYATQSLSNVYLSDDADRSFKIRKFAPRGSRDEDFHLLFKFSVKKQSRKRKKRSKSLDDVKSK